MATLVGRQADEHSLLFRAIELEMDALAAYDEAIDRLQAAEPRAALSEFQRDHARHIVTLSARLRALGGDPPTEADLKRVLTRGKVVLGSLFGDDAILLAMGSNESDTQAAYALSVQRDDLTAETRLIMGNHLADERRHGAWIEQFLEEAARGASASESATAADQDRTPPHLL